MSTTYRPSHADATCDMKYGARAVQGCGRSSARETIGRVAAGAVAKKILKTLAGTEVDTLTELQRLYDELVASADACRLDRYLASEKAGRSRWLWPRFIPQSSYSPVKGLHLFGGVGTGKTMFMDLFFDQFDLQNIGYKNIDARGLITGFQFLQAYYPECLAKCFILHMSRFFVSVWRMVSRFLEKATLEKIVIVTNEDERQDFIKEVGEEVLPKEYGGRAKLVAIQDVVLAPLEG
ncbi:uncharacterized protein LOC126699648 isoform X3 [Quercus robur]|nr:uncharacterized protein LOC126699648 isoform X3 [Quercus robur]